MKRTWCAPGTLLSGVAFAVCLAASSLRAGGNRSEAVPPPLDLSSVIARMTEMNQERAEALRAYVSTRVYRIVYSGMGVRKEAEMRVRMTFHWPDKKEFTILSEKGSRFLLDRVLKRLLESEQEAAQLENRARTDINAENYEFTFEDYIRTPERKFYVLDARPRTEYKYLFRGRVWVDATDFAVVRVEGQPARNPSWWTTRNDIQHSYAKVGDFWLPRRNETFTQLRILGSSLLTIEYTDYELTGALDHSSHASAGVPTPPQGSESATFASRNTE